MKNNILRTLFFIILLFTASLPPASARPTTLGMFLSYEDTVVTVRGQKVGRDGRRVSIQENSGAGVIIDPSGMVVTNTHIIYGSNLIKVALKDGPTMNARVLFVSREYDFSILKVDPPQPLTAVEWADSAHIELGQDVITIGHSPLLHHTISGGQVNGLGTRTLEDGTVTPELLELSINHYPGDSGGPVFDKAGRFIGLINAKRMGMQRAVLAVPANKIHLEYLKLVNPPQNQ